VSRIRGGKGWKIGLRRRRGEYLNAERRKRGGRG